MEIEEFNDLLANMEVVDVPMVGRKFTWYRSGALPKLGWIKSLYQKVGLTNLTYPLSVTERV